MSDTEIKNCDNETVKTDKEQLKKDLTEFINKNKDKLDKSIIRIIEKFVNDEFVNQSELVYLFLNIFMGGEEINELKLLILNSKPQDISTPMQQHLKQYNPTEAAKYQQMQELVNIDKDSPDYRRLMEERLLKDMQDIRFQKTNIIVPESNEDNSILTCEKCEFRKRVGDNRQYLICSKTERELPDGDLNNYVDMFCPFHHKGINSYVQEKASRFKKICILFLVLIISIFVIGVFGMFL